MITASGDDQLLNPTSESEADSAKSDDGLSECSEWSDVGELVGYNYPPPLTAGVYVYTSFEYVKLKIYDKTKRPRQIYGEIKVDRGYKERCVYIFHRHGYQSQVPAEDDDDGRFHLDLYGPRHCIPPDNGYILADLYKEGAVSLLSGEFMLEDNLSNGDMRVPLDVHLDLPDGSGRLTLCYTRIYPSSPANFQFMLIGEAEAGGEASHKQRGEMAVLGTIKAKHILQPTLDPTPNWLKIFQLRFTVTVPYGDPIPVARSHFIMHVMLDHKREHEHEFEDFLIVDVDLQVEVQDDPNIYSIKGEAKIVLYDGAKRETPKYFTVEGKSLNRKKPCGGVPDGLRLKISVTPFLENWLKGDVMQVLIH